MNQSESIARPPILLELGMIFPSLALWSNRDPEDALGRIDRALNDRNHRLSAGLSVTHRFEQIRGALAVSQGHGKYLRVRHVVESCAAIPETLRRGCLAVMTGEQRHCGEIAVLVSDLAEIQAAVVEQLKCEAGKYVDRVLAVAVCDPGIWDRDFDGKISYAPFCDATRLAELSGVTVIDAFPSRDLAVGGLGQQLESLPYWILFGDRDPKVASVHRTLVEVGEECVGYLLPPSDGLDSELPGLRIARTLGTASLDEVIRCNDGKAKIVMEQESGLAEGSLIPELQQRMQAAVLREANSNEQARATSVQSPSGTESVATINACMVEEMQTCLNHDSSNIVDVLYTGLQVVVDQSVEQMKKFGFEGIGQQPAGPTQAGQVLVASSVQYQSCLIGMLQKSFPRSTVVSSSTSGFDQSALPAVVAAVLGLFNIDQMPSNIPWLTGADCQRILGRLTPGRPSNWCQLVRVMADFQPAPMKLKDAI
jgi:anhydro-N-acetylmuramic acid kinase